MIPNNEAIEQLAEKYSRQMVEKRGVLFNKNREWLTAALTEMRDLALREAAEKFQEVCNGYIAYANEAPDSAKEWAKTVIDVAARIRGEATGAILGRVNTK